jgi:hypothetical protein
MRNQSVTNWHERCTCLFEKFDKGSKMNEEIDLFIFLSIAILVLVLGMIRMDLVLN